LKDLHPFNKYTMIENDEWTQFKAYRLSEDFVKKSIQQSDLQKKNKHPHAMGVAGYYGKRLVWDIEDDEFVAAGKPLPFSEIKGQRARDFLRARAKKDASGNYYLPNATDKALYLLMLEKSKDESLFDSMGTEDLLSICLKTKEPPGRSRAVGVNVPHKRAFPLNEEQMIERRKKKKAAKHKEI